MHNEGIHMKYETSNIGYGLSQLVRLSPVAHVAYCVLPRVKGVF